MNVSIKQLQAFVAVAKARSFAEACIQLHLSQPALSITIKKLEDAVGGRLLARSTRSVALTPEGAEFYPVAKRLLSDWDSSLLDVRNLFALRRGKLDIAAMPTFASSLLPSILGRYHQQYADINITVHDVIAEDVVAMVRNGRVDLGISFDPGMETSDMADIHFKPLFSDKFVAVLPQAHPLLKNKKLKWNDLKDSAFITLQRPSSIRLLIDAKLEQQGINITPTFEAHQLASIGRMVSQGMGISVVPALSGEQMMEMGAVCLPISAPVITRKVGVLTRNRFPLSAAAQAMLEVVDQWGASRDFGLSQ